MPMPAPALTGAGVIPPLMVILSPKTMLSFDTSQVMALGMWSVSV